MKDNKMGEICWRYWRDNNCTKNIK